MKKRVALVLSMLLIFLAGLAFAEDASSTANRAITFGQESYTAYIGVAQKLIATVERLSDDAPVKTTLVWSSSDDSILTVSNAGAISGKSAGKATVTVKAKDDEFISDSIEVEVRVPVKTVAINEKNVILLTGADESSAKATLTVTVSPEDAFHQTGTWSSSKEDIVSVDENGNLTGHAAGTANITFVSDDPNGRKAQIPVKVNQAVTTIILNENAVNIPVSRSTTIKAAVEPANAANKKLEWTTEDETIATVSATGQITGKGVGSTVIHAAALDGSGVTTSCRVEVVQPVTSITLSDKSVPLARTITYKLGAEVVPENATIKDIEWISSNENVATVNENGIITAVGKGSATISAVAIDGSRVKASATVKVQDYDLIFTSSEPQKVKYYYGSGRFSIKGSVKTGNVTIPEIDTYMMVMMIGGPAEEEVEVTPVHPGTDTVTIKVGKKKYSYSVYVADSAFSASTLNLAHHKPISSDSAWENLPISNATDGDVYTYWESKGYPANVIVDLKEDIPVASIRIRLNPDPIWGSRTQKIEVLYSADGESYAIAKPEAEYRYDAATGNYVDIDFDTINAQYIKLVFVEGEWENGAQAAEIQVFGPDDQEDE